MSNPPDASPSDEGQSQRVGDSSLSGDGDLRAFELLFRREYASLCRFALRYVRDAQAAEDIVQDLFAALWAARGGMDLHAHSRAYLFTAVRNRSLNVRKRELVERAWSHDEALPDVRALHRRPVQPDEALETREVHAEVEAAMRALPERLRMVMQLRWQEQMSYAEIAAILSISIKGVENQLSRGLRALRLRFLERLPP